MRASVTVAILVSGLVAAWVAPATAQSIGERDGVRRERAERPRIRVTPNQRLVRQCEDWYVVERRVTGPTVVPNSRCWWAYR
jgi:hypothetical protein